MIVLEKSSLVGKGLHRECYLHPDNDLLCVKVIVNGNMDEHNREQSYYRHMTRKNIPWEMIPRFHGTVNTNMGEGAVFDLIRDHDGDVSKTLEYYFNSSDILENQLPGFTQAFYNFKNYLLEYNIITMNLKPKNILYKKESDNEGRLYLVDSIGNSDFIPIANHVNFLAKKKIQRKWERFEYSLLQKYNSNKVLFNILKSHC